jgi:hypothetical protein
MRLKRAARTGAVRLRVRVQVQVRVHVRVQVRVRGGGCGAVDARFGVQGTGCGMTVEMCECALREEGRARSRATFVG